MQGENGRRSCQLTQEQDHACWTKQIFHQRINIYLFFIFSKWLSRLGDQDKVFRRKRHGDTS